MKIENMKINAFGKLHNVDISLKDNINIIQGKNESGKSTILKFIINSFYGTSKNKKGKDTSDFEKFKPWEGEDFSGKIKYKLDNGESYEIFREFNKKNPKVYNENLEDISKQFSIDKNKGNEFFYEQTKIDEELFLSTSAILQQEVIIEKKMQTTIIQKIANLVGTGDDNVSYKRAIERLTRRQLDEVGTERSREKPINIIKRKIDETNLAINELSNYEDEKYEIENNKKEIVNKIEDEETKYELLNEIKKLNERKEIEKEKIKLQEKIKNENNEKINSIKNEIENIEENKKIKKEQILNEKKKKINKNKTKIAIIFTILILANCVQAFLIKNKILCFVIMLLSVVFGAGIVYINKRNTKNLEDDKDNIQEKDSAIFGLQSEMNLLKQNTKRMEDEIKIVINNFNLKYNLEKEKIKNNYINKIDENELNNYFNLENINYLLDNLQKNINNEKINLHTLDINKDNIEKNLEKKANLEEKLSILSQQYVNLQNLNLSMNLAKDVLNSCYEKMKETVTPKFTEQLSDTIAKITNRKIQ